MTEITVDRVGALLSRQPLLRKTRTTGTDAMVWRVCKRADVRRLLSAQAGQVTGEVNSLSEKVQELSQQVSEQKDQVAAEARRLEETLTTNAASFDHAQTDHEQRFTQQLTDLEPRLQDAIERSTTSLTEALEDLTTKANTAWEEVAAVKERAENASSYLGVSGLAAGYSQTADAEDQRSFWLRMSAIGCFLGAIAVSVFALIYHVTHNFALDGFLTKLGVSIPVLVLAGYLARESSKHSERANFSRLRQRQLESLPAYVDGLPVEQRACALTTSSRFKGHDARPSQCC